MLYYKFESSKLQNASNRLGRETALDSSHTEITLQQSEIRNILETSVQKDLRDAKIENMKMA